MRPYAWLFPVALTLVGSWSARSAAQAPGEAEPPAPAEPPAGEPAKPGPGEVEAPDEEAPDAPDAPPSDGPPDDALPVGGVSAVEPPAEPAASDPSPAPTGDPEPATEPVEPEEEDLVLAAGADHLLGPPVFTERWLVDHGRFDPPEPSHDSMAFSMHGEYQLRFRAMTDLRLQRPESVAPGQAETLGQNAYLYHWLRLRPLFQYRDKLKVVGEIDLPRGVIAGATTEWVDVARDSMDEINFYEVHPRKLYFEYQTPVGLVRIGHQTSHWGMGLLANDGDHATLFGDYRRGSIVERLLFATRPGGADHPLAIALGGDLVFEDSKADLVDDGDRALQAVLALRWTTDEAEAGLYGVYRHPERDSVSINELTPYTEELDVWVVDLSARFNVPVVGNEAFVFGELEAMVIGGSTTFVRNIELTQVGEEEEVQTFGGAAKLGTVRYAEDGEHRWGDIAIAVEAGYASGDADPYDGVTRRMTFDQNHKVGLVLFNHVLGWKTARAATLASDRDIVNRPAPGAQLLPSEGGIFGASYLNPTVVVRPTHWLDLKGGVVIAQTTADLVDPYHFGALGDWRNYDGGEDENHDLGVELDLGADARIPLADWMMLNVGAEGGVLFPGGAFDDAAGTALPNQYLLNTKLGMQY